LEGREAEPSAGRPRPAAARRSLIAGPSSTLIGATSRRRRRGRSRPRATPHSAPARHRPALVLRPPAVRPRPLYLHPYPPRPPTSTYLLDPRHRAGRSAPGARGSARAFASAYRPAHRLYLLNPAVSRLDRNALADGRKKVGHGTRFPSEVPPGGVDGTAPPGRVPALFRGAFSRRSLCSTSPLPKLKRILRILVYSPNTVTRDYDCI
jgi:hypothetical protein